jgi:hypothetical protein
VTRSAAAPPDDGAWRDRLDDAVAGAVADPVLLGKLRRGRGNADRDWTAGGCGILAAAICRVAGGSMAALGYDPGGWDDIVVTHAYAIVGGVCFDARGSATPDEVIADWSETFGAQAVWSPVTSESSLRDRYGISADQALIAATERAIRGRLSAEPLAQGQARRAP